MRVSRCDCQFISISVTFISKHVNLVSSHVQVTLGATSSKDLHSPNLICSYLWWLLEHSRFWSPVQTDKLKGGNGKRKEEKEENQRILGHTCTDMRDTQRHTGTNIQLCPFLNNLSSYGSCREVKRVAEKMFRHLSLTTSAPKKHCDATVGHFVIAVTTL